MKKQYNPMIMKIEKRHGMAPALLVVTLLVFSCSGDKSEYDASGTFEADETIVSAEGNGTLLKFDVEEGQTLEAGQVLGYIDSTQLYLKKQQLQSQIRSTLSQRPDIRAQLASLQVQLQTAEREQKRVSNLLRDNAATQKQMDDANAQVELVKKQIAAQQSSLGITSESITEQASPLRIQIAQVEDQLAKCRIVNPVNGMVLTKYAEVNEMAATGKPLYKIADLSEITLRAYITGEQLSRVKIGQKVNVLVDNGNKDYNTLPGELTWVSSKAEFTPKTIQTREERANLVYAIKVRVKNDGSLKLGMYAEVKF
jgi:HlyD family secretion protein